MQRIKTHFLCIWGTMSKIDALAEELTIFNYHFLIIFVDYVLKKKKLFLQQLRNVSAFDQK